MRQFWGQQQRFFREMATAAKVEFVVIQAKEALADGMSVVVGLQSTGESGLDKVGGEGSLAFMLLWMQSDEIVIETIPNCAVPNCTVSAGVLFNNSTVER